MFSDGTGDVSLYSALSAKACLFKSYKSGYLYGCPANGILTLHATGTGNRTGNGTKINGL